MKFNLGPIFKKIFHRRRMDALIRHPRHDWKKIVIGFMSGLLVSLGLSAYLFWGIDAGTLFRPSRTSENAIPSIDRASISTLSNFYDQREDVIANLKASSTAVVDPSL